MQCNCDNAVMEEGRLCKPVLALKMKFNIILPP